MGWGLVDRKDSLLGSFTFLREPIDNTKILNPIKVLHVMEVLYPRVRVYQITQSHLNQN